MKEHHLILDGIPLCQHPSYFWRYGFCHYYGFSSAEAGVNAIKRRFPNLDLHIIEGRCQFKKES